jgi:hypothetical protein
VQREVDAGGEPARGRDAAAVDEAQAAPELDVRKLLGEAVEEVVVSRRGDTLQEASARELECAGADRHRDIGTRARPLEPITRFGRRAVRRHHHDVRLRRIADRVVRLNLQAARHLEQPFLRRDRVKLEWGIVSVRRGGVLEHLPRTHRVDDIGVVTEHEGDLHAFPARQRVRGPAGFCDGGEGTAENPDRGRQRRADEMSSLHGPSFESRCCPRPQWQDGPTSIISCHTAPGPAAMR